jgi:hypothetical protein
VSTDKISIPENGPESQRDAAKKHWDGKRRRDQSAIVKNWWAKRRQKFEDKYGAQSVGAYQTAANPGPSFRDWTVNVQTGAIVAHTDWMQPEFLLHRYGGSFVLRESNLMAGGKSLAQDCSIPKRDANGFLIEDGPVDLKEAA